MLANGHICLDQDFDHLVNDNKQSAQYEELMPF